MFTRLLVPTDFSAPSDAALAHARTLADAFGAELHVLHLTENVFLHAVVSDPQAIATAAERNLSDRLTDEDRRRFQVTVAVERSDHPADEIVSYARTHNINLIVMGTHSRSGVSHAVIGSVAEKVVRAAPCPVVTIREAPAASTPASVDINRILVPTDFSAPSDAALSCGRKLASGFGASLHLLHVLDDLPGTAALGAEFNVPEPPEARMARIKGAQERLSHRMGTHDPGGASATTEVIVGRSAETIARYAADGEYDLIVMGTHGRRGIAHLLMGSVAEHVIRTARCPVMTVRDLAEPATLPAADPGAIGALA